jgi:hypothetical protein
MTSNADGVQSCKCVSGEFIYWLAARPSYRAVCPSKYSFILNSIDVFTYKLEFVVGLPSTCYLPVSFIIKPLPGYPLLFGSFREMNTVCMTFLLMSHLIVPCCALFICPAGGCDALAATSSSKLNP